MSIPTRTELTTCILDALDDLKGREVIRLDVEGIADFADTMIVCTGTSGRHLNALAGKVAEATHEKLATKPLHLEGDAKSDWVLVDYGDIIVHLMLAEARSLYDLERLWSVRPLQKVEAR
ncbi:MAG: ribosome silencing factor [Pseudomonadota bacterium]